MEKENVLLSEASTGVRVERSLIAIPEAFVVHEQSHQFQASAGDTEGNTRHHMTFTKSFARTITSPLFRAVSWLHQQIVEISLFNVEESRASPFTQESGPRFHAVIRV